MDLPVPVHHVVIGRVCRAGLYPPEPAAEAVPVGGDNDRCDVPAHELFRGNAKDRLAPGAQVRETAAVVQREDDMAEGLDKIPEHAVVHFACGDSGFRVAFLLVPRQAPPHETTAKSRTACRQLTYD